MDERRVVTRVRVLTHVHVWECTQEHESFAGDHVMVLVFVHQNSVFDWCNTRGSIAC